VNKERINTVRTVGANIAFTKMSDEDIQYLIDLAGEELEMRSQEHMKVGDAELIEETSNE